jgi:ABC-type glycerol-3-phosphate transport system permease component
VMVPAQVYMVPLYITMSRLGLVDTRAGVVFP